MRSRLSKIARDSTLAPWQRDYKLWVERHGAEDTATMPSAALRSTGLRSGGLTADDGAWVAIPPPIRRYGSAAIYDPLRDRMVVLRGRTDSGGDPKDVWALSLTGSSTWSELAPAGTPPSGSSEQTAIYDPVRDRIVVFGGSGSGSDVWALSLSGSPAWSVLAPTGTPPTRRVAHTAIYDPVRDRMVVFGGFDGDSVRNDVWALSLSGSAVWSELTPAGTPPTARVDHTAIYDPVRDRMVVFGGSGDNSTWALSLAGSPAWSELVPAGTPPTARVAHTAIYDPVRDRMIVFGGWDGSVFNDVWALSLSESPTWSELAPAGTPPTARAGHTAIYDPVRDRMVVFAGFDNREDIGSNDVWALSLTGGPIWRELVPSPDVRGYHTAIYDPVVDRMVVFGGYDDSGYRNDVSALSLSGNPAWSELSPAGPTPTPRAGHTAIYDPVRDRMVLFGGSFWDGSYHYLNDVWALSLSGSPEWSQLVPEGTPPSARSGHMAIYDPVRDRMLVFGGSGDSGVLNDVWVLSLAGSPTWSELVPEGELRPQYYGRQTAIYDPVRDRMVVYGGPDSGDDRHYLWALSLSGSPAWSEIVPEGERPRPRFDHTAIYDPVRDRMVVFAGDDGGDDRLDVQALSLAGNPTWNQLFPAGHWPGQRSVHTAIYDPVRDRMVVFGGNKDSRGLLNDAWALVWGAPVPPVAMAFDLTPNTLNLVSQGLWVTGFLEPPSSFAASAIDIASIRLNGTVPVDPEAPTTLGDHDGNGVPDLMVKFNRTALELTLPEGDNIAVTVIGTVADRSFSGTDYIRVRRAVVTAPAAGGHLTAGSVAQVCWQMPSGVTVQSVALLQSFDGGNTWSLIASGQPNTGSHSWTVPNAQTDQAKVAVVLVESADSTGDVVDGVLGVSEAFSIEGVVSVGDRGPTRLAMRGATPNPSAGGRLRVEFALCDGSPARLELIDVAGRVLTSRQVGSLGPGTHALDVSEGIALRPGIYFLRLMQGGTEVRARAAVTGGFGQH